MTKVTNKVSVYGDSVSTAPSGGVSRASRINSYSTKFSTNGVNDYALGGTNFAGTIDGKDGYGANMWGGDTFAQHLVNTDNGDIVVIGLGGNDKPIGASGSLIPSGAANSEAYVGCDNLTNVANITAMVQQAQATGKRPVLVGLPYFNTATARATGGVFSDAEGGTDAMAQAFCVRLAVMNGAVRQVAWTYSVPCIATYGWGGAGGHPSADSSSTVDGIHPTVTYANAVNDYVAAQIISLFSL